MIEQTQNNRCKVVQVQLVECPWLRGTNVQLPGYVHQDFSSTLGDIRQARLHPGVMIRCFESLSGKYVINLHYNSNATRADKDKAIKALDKWVKALSEPRSCSVDPHTGQSPSNVTDYTW